MNAQKFDIVFNSIPASAVNIEWLKKIKTQWYATAINLRLKWHQVEPNNNKFSWSEVDNALNAIHQNGLHIYIRIAMATENPYWVVQNDSWEKELRSAVLTTEDVHHRANGSLYLNRYFAKPVLNVTSKNSQYYMRRYVDSVLAHLTAWIRSAPSRKGAIKLIVPTLSPDDESEYPSYTRSSSSEPFVWELTGYSKVEIAAFRDFLKNKYKALEKINSRWNAKFTSLAQINPRDYDWQDCSKDSFTYYPNGRIDFLEFRTNELKKFFDLLATDTHRAGFRFGLQFGSIYDQAIDSRGLLDVTPLLEKADHIIVGDIYEYRPDLPYSAAFCRSISNFWSDVQSRKTADRIQFSTESNWPHYQNLPAEELCAFWKEELEDYYFNGASAHFISAWDISPESPSAGEILDNRLLPDYRIWQETLNAYSGKNIVKINYDEAEYLNFEALNHSIKYSDGFISHRNNAFNKYVKRDPKNDVVGLCNIFPIFYAQWKKDAQKKLSDIVPYRRNFITAYMIARSPAHLSRYKKIYVNESNAQLNENSEKQLKPLRSKGKITTE